MLGLFKTRRLNEKKELCRIISEQYKKIADYYKRSLPSEELMNSLHENSKKSDNMGSVMAGAGIAFGAALMERNMKAYYILSDIYNIYSTSVFLAWSKDELEKIIEENNELLREYGLKKKSLKHQRRNINLNKRCQNKNQHSYQY